MAAAQRRTHTLARIRPARAADAGELASFERRVFLRYYAPHRFSQEQFRYYLARPETIAYVAVVDGAIVGYALGVAYTGTRRHAARLLSIAVSRTRRGRGDGRRLLQAFIAAARRRGCRSVSLEVAAANTAAKALFSANGFSFFRRIRAYYSASMDALRMRRILQAVR